MKCANCLAELPKSIQFCPSCGVRVEVQVSSAQPFLPGLSLREIGMVGRGNQTYLSESPPWAQQDEWDRLRSLGKG